MSNRLLLTLAFLCVLSASAVALHTSVDAQNDPTAQETCRERVQAELTLVLDDYRAHVFGSRPELLEPFSVPLTGGAVEGEPILGILETKGRMTSELITPLVDSYRTLRCRALAVCSVMEQSFVKRGGEVSITELGCPEVETERYAECHFLGETDRINDDESQTPFVGMISECGALVESSLQMERAILGLAVTYDAGYRSNLQLAGMYDRMMGSLSKDALTTTAGTVNMFGKLHQIPCFIGQCDAPSTDFFTE